MNFTSIKCFYKAFKINSRDAEDYKYELIEMLRMSGPFSGPPFSQEKIYCQLRARRALSQFNDAPLRTRRVPSLYKVYGDSTVLVLR